MTPVLLLVTINGVDGMTVFSIQTPNRDKALEFLVRYDHEGSSIELELAVLTPLGRRTIETLEQEAAYRYLRTPQAGQP